MKRGITFLSLLILVLCGCLDATSPPKTFSRFLSTADRIEVTNHWYAFGSSIAGAEVSKIAQAVASSKKNKIGAAMAWKNPQVWELEFRAGTNYLATIRTCAGVFEVAGIEYRDGSETLLASWKKLQAQLQAHLEQSDADGNSKSYK